MKDTIKYLVWIFAIVPFLIACGDSNTDDAPTDDFVYWPSDKVGLFIFACLSYCLCRQAAQ